MGLTTKRFVMAIDFAIDVSDLVRAIVLIAKVMEKANIQTAKETAKARALIVTAKETEKVLIAKETEKSMATIR